MKIPRSMPRLCARLLTVPALALLLAGTARADYQSTVLANKPVGYWPLNETSGTTASDISGNEHDGVYQSGVALGVAGVPNPPFTGFAADGLAAGFSGSLGDSSCVTLANLPIFSANVTIMEWIYPTDASRLGTSFWNAGQNSGFGCANNTALGYNWKGGSGNQWTYSSFTPPVNQWSFVAMVITPTNAVFYMGNADGLVTDVHNEGQIPVNFTTGTVIGGPKNGSTTGFNGSLSDVAIFDASLTPDQIAQIFTAGSGSIPPPPVPTGLSAAAGNAQVSISWDANSKATGYKLKRSTTSGGETTIASLTGTGSTAYTDTGLANGTTYYYTVSAVNSGGESANAAEVSATPSGAITSYAAGVLALNPVGFWPLNETSGATALDISGNGNNGAYQSGVALGVAGVPNPPFTGFTASGLAAGFRGAAGNSSCVTLSNLPVNSANVTIMEWIYPTNASRLGTSFWNAGQNAGLGCANETSLGYNWHGGSGWQWTYAPFAPPVNQWSFVAMVITPNNTVFYMGNAGGLVSAVNNDGNSPVDFTTGTAIGGPNNGSTTGFYGSMCDVAVFDASLTPAQITQLFIASGGNNLPPAITAQPISQNVYANGTASFSVTAIGAAPLCYQWWHGTAPLAGQTNALLTINSAQASDAGQYSVVVTNNFGSATSTVATLTLATPPVAYQNLVLADGPVGYWPLDLNVDAKGKATDLTGNGNDGTYVNIASPVNQAVGPSTYMPNAINLNGNAYVSLPNTPGLNIGGLITMEAWVQPGAAQSSDPANILAMGWTFTGEDFLNVAGGHFGGGRDNGYYVTGPAVTPHWTHVVGTYDGTQWNLYINGELFGTKLDSKGATPDIGWAIGSGSGNGGNRYFKGSLSHVALYNFALTSDQVLAHYALATTGTTNVAPVITTQPASQRVVTNTPATFAVKVMALPAPTYQWYSVIGGVTNAISGATSATYTTAPVQDSDTGKGYFVVIRNSIGEATSQTAILTAGHELTLSGFLKVEQYYGNYPDTSTAFSAFYPTASLPAPDKVEYLTSFNANQNLPDNSCQRIYGWFTPPVSGNYVFFVATDDASALWLSTDATPANAHQIAQNQAWMWSSAGPDWTCSNTSSAEYPYYGYYGTMEWRSDQFMTMLGGGFSAFANLTAGWSPWPNLNDDGSIPLVAGQKYYIELDHNQQSGGQSAAVTYKLASDPDPNPGDATLLTGKVISATVPDTLAPKAQPVITEVHCLSGQIIMSGTNGLAGTAYNVLTTTNLAAPLANWTILSTGQFDANGNFGCTNTLPVDGVQQFYRLQMPQ